MHKFAPLLYSYMLAPTCFGSSLPSSGNVWIRRSSVKIQTDMVVYRIMCLSGLCVGVSWFCIQATHPQSQAGKRHVSFAPRQRKATLQWTNSGRHDKSEIHSSSTPSLQPRFGTVRFLVVPNIEGDVSSDAEVEAAVRKWISSQPWTEWANKYNDWKKCVAVIGDYVEK
jgi:hypothetical protein